MRIRQLFLGCLNESKGICGSGGIVAKPVNPMHVRLFAEPGYLPFGVLSRCLLNLPDGFVKHHLASQNIPKLRVS